MRLLVAVPKHRVEQQARVPQVVISTTGPAHELPRPHRYRPIMHAFHRLILCLVASVPGFVAAQDRPNIILIMADDFGVECVGAHGGTSYQTPNLDQLASSGMLFHHAYAQPLCTPTRVQIMTGQSNVRNYTRFGQLEPSQITFAHLFRKAGYATAIVGKWQLGGGFEGPSHFGFDEYCLWQLTRRPSRYPNPGLEINGREVNHGEGEYGPKLINDYALDFIARHKDKPFLLYYPMILTHDPIVPTPDSAEWNPKALKEGEGRDVQHFAAMTAYMDKMIGRLIAELKKHGLREKTLILFTGDNGTSPSITSKMGDRSVRGGKGSSTNNGIHVPLIASWPGTIPAGARSDDLVDTTDYLPTLCAAAGIPLPASTPVDGISFLPQLRQQPNPARRESIYCWYAREGGSRPTYEFAFDQHYKLYRDGRFYDLKSDGAEQSPLKTSDLPSSIQQQHAKLQATLDRFQNTRPAEIAAQRGPARNKAKRKASAD